MLIDTTLPNIRKLKMIHGDKVISAIYDDIREKTLTVPFVYHPIVDKAITATIILDFQVKIRVEEFNNRMWRQVC